MENPIKMDDLGVPPFKETPIYHQMEDVDFQILCLESVITHQLYDNDIS